MFPSKRGQGPQGSGPREEYAGPSGDSYDDHYLPPGERPLGYWFGRALWETTRGSARIDLIRPSRQAAVPMQQGAGLLGLPMLNARSLFGAEQPFEERDQYGFHAFGDSQARKRGNILGALGSRSGARVKVMRHVDFGYHNRRHQPVFSDYDRELQYRNQTEDLGPSAAFRSMRSKLAHDLLGGNRPWFDLGAGLNFELDTARLDIKARLKIKDLFSIKLLPRPTFRLQKRVFLPGSAAAVRVNYEVPVLQALDRHRSEPVPARLWLRMENAVGYGTHLTPSGLDFDEHSWYLGGGTSLRTGASIGFPRQIPIPAGESPLNWRVQRLGLKTVW